MSKECPQEVYGLKGGTKAFNAHEKSESAAEERKEHK